jgi:hypothetical protein
MRIADEAASISVRRSGPYGAIDRTRQAMTQVVSEDAARRGLDHLGLEIPSARRLILEAALFYLNQ